MKALLKYKIGLVFCFCISISNLLSAQSNFNTARFENKGDSTKMLVEEKTKTDAPKTVKKGWLKQIFKRKEKPNLKRELDSLKNLIIQKDKEHKSTIAKIESSLGGVIKSEIAKIKVQSKEIKETKKQKWKEICTPLKMMFITSPFGMRKHPIDRGVKMHNGIDLRANNEHVYAVMDGQVIESGFDKQRGFFLRISHTEKLETVYLHLSEIYYKKGENVKAGFVVAKSGNTGKSAAPHLHFAVKDGGKYINPMPFLNKLIEINNILNINQYGEK